MYTYFFIYDLLYMQSFSKISLFNEGAYFRETSLLCPVLVFQAVHVHGWHLDTEMFRFKFFYYLRRNGNGWQTEQQVLHPYPHGL